AEALKREKNFLSGTHASAEFAAAVDGWAAELKRQLNEWFQANPALAAEVPTFELIASGGGFDQPGLLDYLRTASGLSFEIWPGQTMIGSTPPDKGFEVAFGTALQALGYCSQPVSLLPDDYRLAWRKRLSRQRIELASLGLVLICALLLGVGTWRKGALID